MNAPRLPPGAVVGGKYRIAAMLGHGGSSATYQAASTEAQVALKLMSPQLAQRPDMVQAMQQFHAGTNSLPSELVVPVVDAGFDATSNSPFSVTELMRVPSLAQLVAQRPLSAEDVARFMSGLARAIDAAHQRQMAHHALKPTNVFIAGPPYDGVRVMDFGASLVRSVVPTQEGYEASAPWLAPEQAQASAPAGPAADIFSAALLAFYAMTGRSFWLSCQGQHPDVASWQREIASPAPPFSARAREVGFPLSPALDLVFARALATNPAERYRSVGELATSLTSATRAQSSEATMAFPSSAFEPPPGAGKPDTGYPPAPAPLGAAPAQAPGGFAPGGMPAGGMPPGGMPPGGMPPGGMGAPGGDASALQAMQAVSPMQQTQVGLPAPPKGSKAATIFVALIALVLVGGVATAFVLMRHKPAADAGPIAIAASAESAASAPSTVPAAATEAPSAEASAEPSAAASAEPAATATDVAVKLTCDPACDKVAIDGKDVADPTSLELPPGTHKVHAEKDGYLPVDTSITLATGTPFEKELKLTVKPAAPVTHVTHAPPTTKKPCGKFLKRCN